VDLDEVRALAMSPRRFEGQITGANAPRITRLDPNSRQNALVGFSL
jgi:hypothetical protein